ncbi:MAG: hypothetical protein IRZ33_11500 [Alicyclobacillaceae bacterium]|nr:hypothetical protein [Alicyclobacillaceae bacterium]
MTLEEYLSVPYVLEMWSVQRPDGVWVRHAEYPELPGCSAESLSTVEAMERAEAARIEYIVSKWEKGEQIPIPRPPLRV